MTRINTGRKPYQKTGKTRKSRKPMNRVSEKRRKHRASQGGQEALAYMGKVKQLPCCVCGAPAPSDAHHPICDRWSARRVEDFDVIPLCQHCHRYPFKDAIHTNKREWVERNGPDYLYIEQTRKLIEGID
jgi:hypothetical protein